MESWARNRYLLQKRITLSTGYPIDIRRICARQFAPFRGHKRFRIKSTAIRSEETSFDDLIVDVIFSRAAVQLCNGKA